MQKRKRIKEKPCEKKDVPYLKATVIIALEYNKIGELCKLLSIIKRIKCIKNTRVPNSYIKCKCFFVFTLACYTYPNSCANVDYGMLIDFKLDENSKTQLILSRKYTHTLIHVLPDSLHWDLNECKTKNIDTLIISLFICV